MNREETLALYEQGKDAWNKWANEMLEERKRLEEAGEWEVDYMNRPKNEVTKIWLEKAKANFSNEETPHTFEKEVNFGYFIFPEKASFDTATFKKSAWFYETFFKEEAYFNNAFFKEEAVFSKATYKKAAVFINTTFNKSTWFNNITFKEASLFKTALFKGETTFKNTKFIDEAIFNAIRVESAFALEKTKFLNQVPNFIQASFKEAPRLDNIEFGYDVPPGSFGNSITIHTPTEIKVRYQALKRLAIQAHDHENEQRFWAGELRSDRSLRTEDGGWNLRPLVSAFWWGNIAYGCVSDYGYSIVKPIGALLILICLMTGLHLTKSKTPLTYDQVFSAGYIAANKSFLFLGADPTKRNIIKEKYTALYGANENQTPKIPKTILTAEFFQTLLSAIFIFLALLGIRNNFKMK